MPTNRGRVRREDAARIRIETAQNIIRDALGVPLPSFEEPYARDAETRRMFMLENLAQWMEALATALQNTPPQEIAMQSMDVPPGTITISTVDGGELFQRHPDFSTEQKTAYPIADLELGERITSALMEAGIEWDWQIPHDDRNLRDIAGIGPAAIAEIREAQAKLTDEPTD